MRFEALAELAGQRFTGRRHQAQAGITLCWQARGGHHACKAGGRTIKYGGLYAAPGAQREIKQLFAQLAPGAMDPATLELTAQTISRVRATPEARAGFAAFFNQRPPPGRLRHE